VSISREAKSAYNRLYNETHPGANRERSRRWREDNPDAARAGARRYRVARPGANRERSRRWREDRPEAARESGRRWRAVTRDKVLTYYSLSSAPCCACCITSRDLSIDHVNGGGKEHRKQLFGTGRGNNYRFYVWLIEQGYPDGFQVLCRPCNSSKGEGERCRLDHALAEAGAAGRAVSDEQAG
jgi:hypothetical protein